MKINIASGKTIEMSLENFLDFSDEEYLDYVSRQLANDAGVMVNDPFINFIIKKDKIIEIDDFEIEELPEEIISEIKKEFEE